MLRPMRCVVAFLILLAGPASAADEKAWRDDINERASSAWGLNWFCTKPDRAARELCEHIIGTTLAVHRAMALNHPELAAYCWDRREPTIDEARAAFLRWYGKIDVRSAPGLALTFEAPAGVTVLAALREAAPCP